MQPKDFYAAQERLLAACLNLTGLPLNDFIETIEAHNPRIPDLDETTKILSMARTARYICNVLSSDSHLLWMAHEASTRYAREEAARQSQRTSPQ